MVGDKYYFKKNRYQGINIKADKEYRQTMERYGSIEIKMYNFIVSTLGYIHQNKTTKEMISLANTKINQLSGKKHNKRNTPSKTTNNDSGIMGGIITVLFILGLVLLLVKFSK